MATGAIRFAARQQADIIPCAITNEGPWQYRLTLGRPAPRELLADEANWPQIGQHLLKEMMPLFKAHPHQCWDAMTRRLVRNTDSEEKLNSTRSFIGETIRFAPENQRPSAGTFTTAARP